jgi:hypothetical protein
VVPRPPAKTVDEPLEYLLRKGFDRPDYIVSSTRTASEPLSGSENAMAS